MTRPTCHRSRRALHGEHGIAMVTAVLAITVTALLAIVAMNLAIHNQDATGRDRARTQAVHAAEAGINDTIRRISVSTPAALPCNDLTTGVANSGTLTATPTASFSVSVTYYATNPPSGTPLTCTPGVGFTASNVPVSAQIKSIGSVGATGGALKRTMQAQISLAATYGQFDKAVFSNSDPSITNQINLNGFNGNDANFYTNGSWSCPNQTTVNGDVVAQGTISISNSCYIANDAWAGGAVTMSNTAKVNHDAKSSTSTLTMANNSKVVRNVRVGTTCSGCTTGSGGRVGGTVTTNSPQSAPPSTPYPSIRYNPVAWTNAGYTPIDTTCANARTWLISGANDGTKAVLNITGGCTLSLSNDTVNRTNDVAIVTDGPISTTSNTKFQSGDSSFHDLFIISTTPDAWADGSASSWPCPSPASAGSAHTVFMASSTGFSSLHFFVYAPCTVSFANNNSGSRGQIYGNPVAFASNLSYTYYPTTVPGAGSVTGFQPQLSFVREIQ